MTDYAEEYVAFVAKCREKNGRCPALRVWQRSQLHHVMPRSLGGEDIPENYALMTKEEHKTAHALLNLALIQAGDFDSLRKLDYKQISQGVVIDLKSFSKARIEMIMDSEPSFRFEASLTNAALITGGGLSRLHHGIQASCRTKNMQDAVRDILMKSVFGLKRYGYTFRFVPHRNADLTVLRRIAERLGTKRIPSEGKGRIAA